MTASFGNPLIDTQTTSNARPRTQNKTRASSSPSPRLGKSDSPIFGFPLPLPCSPFLLPRGLGWCFLGKGIARLLSLSQGHRPFMESGDLFNVQFSLSDTYLSHKHWECWLPFILICMVERDAWVWPHCWSGEGRVGCRGNENCSVDHGESWACCLAWRRASEMSVFFLYSRNNRNCNL